MKIAQLQIPGPNGSSETVELPSSIPTALKNGSAGGTKLLQLGIEYLTITGTVLALIVIIVSGIQMITSKGDAFKLSEAKRRLMFGIIGLIVVLSAFFIVKVILIVLHIEDANYLFNPADVLQRSST